ncbi:hypothetical protein V6N13_046801 [Hibiscus sabdariffa]|uniref:Uncharacterized protein n=2 Tax=Hibiscus sabdariffa TaxID=183260 RepID=A0ABR2A7Z9_9ROSI
MGGCTSKPKEFSRAAEAPIKSKKTQNETSDRENVDGGENKTEKSVEVSESNEKTQPSSELEVAGGGESVSSKENGGAEPVKKGEVDREPSEEEAKRNEPTKEE